MLAAILETLWHKKQPKCLSTGEWICPYNGYDSVIKRNKLVIHVTTGINLKIGCAEYPRHKRI